MYDAAISELERYKLQTLTVEILRERLDILDEKSKAVSSPLLDGMPHGTGTTDRTGTLATKIIKLMDDIDRETAKAEQVYTETEMLIDSIPSRSGDQIRQRALLKLRFLDLLSFNECNRVLFGNRPDFEDKEESYRRTSRNIYNRGLKAIEKNLDEGGINQNEHNEHA